ncbi:MAG: peptidoglycan-associated lipoprotein Pal [Candidatus Zixiibacteriota bacterium]
MRRALLILSFLLVMLFIFGCPKKTEPPELPPVIEEPPVEEVEIEPEPVPDPEPAPTIDLRPVYFEYDQHDLTDEAKAVLKDNAQELMEFSDQDVLLEGHCDERGTEQYNLSLGQKRAESVKQFLVNYGVADSRIRTISYGEERPVCKQDTESCWSKNRRVEFIPE